MWDMKTGALLNMPFPLATSLPGIFEIMVRGAERTRRIRRTEKIKKIARLSQTDPPQRHPLNCSRPVSLVINMLQATTMILA